MAEEEDAAGAEEAKRTETDTPGRGGSGLAGEDADDDLHKFSTKVYLNEKSLVHMLSDNVRVNLKSGAKAVIDLFLSKLRQTESVAVAKYGTWEEYFLAGAKLDGYENLGRKLTDHLAAIHSVYDDELRSPLHWNGSTNVNIIKHIALSSPKHTTLTLTTACTNRCGRYHYLLKVCTSPLRLAVMVFRARSD